MSNELGTFKNELTDHTLAVMTGPSGWFVELICPDNCADRPWHQDDWANNGADLVVSVDEEVVIGIIPVIPEVRKMPQDHPHPDKDDEELWFRPVVPEAE